MAESRNRADKTDEVKTSLQLTINTGDKDFDGYFEGGMQIVNGIFDVWHLAVVHKIRSDYERSKKILDKGKETFFNKYLKDVLGNFRNGDWWANTRKYIFKQLARYAYEQHLEILSGKLAELSKMDEQAKKKLAGLFYFHVRSYRSFLNSPYAVRALSKHERDSAYDAYEKLNETINTLIKEKEFPSSKQRGTYEKQHMEVEELLQKCFALLDEAENQWAKLGIYPLLRSPLLVNVAEIIKSMHDKINGYATAVKPNKLLAMLVSDESAGAISLRAQLRNELSKIAEAMLLQEKLYQENQSQLIHEEDEHLDESDLAEMAKEQKAAQAFCDRSIDLMLHLQHRLYEVLAPTLDPANRPKKVLYSCLELVNSYPARWSDCDADIRALFSRRAEHEESARKGSEQKESVFRRYLEYIPERATLVEQSQYRRNFILQFGEKNVQESLKRQCLVDSVREKAESMAKFFSPESVRNLKKFKKRKEVFFKLMTRLLANYFQFKMCGWETFLRQKDVMPTLIILDKEQGFPHIYKLAQQTGKSVDIIAYELHLLQGICVRPDNRDAWIALLQYFEKQPVGLKTEFVVHVYPKIQKMQKKAENYARHNAPEIRCRSLIWNFLRDTYGYFDSIQFHRSKDDIPEEQESLPLAVALHGVYHRPKELESWQQALNPKLMTGRKSQHYLNLVQYLFSVYLDDREDEQLQKTCRTYYRVCLSLLNKQVDEQFMAVIAETHARTRAIAHELEDTREQEREEAKSSVPSSSRKTARDHLREGKESIVSYLCEKIANRQDLPPEARAIARKSVRKFLEQDASDKIEEKDSGTKLDPEQLCLRCLQSSREADALREIYHDPQDDGAWEEVLDTRLFDDKQAKKYLGLARELINCFLTDRNQKAEHLEQWRKCREVFDESDCAEEVLGIFSERERQQRALVSVPRTGVPFCEKFKSTYSKS